MNDFLQRLRERKLVQWALAYGAAAFALIQVLDIVAQRFDWPGQAIRFVIIALVIGFFVALVLAWYHGERGAQRVSGTELSILALLLAIGGAVTWRLAPTATEPMSTSASATGSRQAAAADASISDKSIAVLPFDNLSADKDNEYFASGMQDMILTKLSDIAELKVASRTSTQKYRSHPDDIRTIAQALGVGHVLEGSVQKSGSQVLINLQLIDAATDKHVWAQSYTRTLDNIFGVEGEVAQTVADALKAKLSPAEAEKVAEVGTHNKEAYDLLLRSKYFLDNANRTGDWDNLKRSVELAQQAIALDPDYVAAYTQLALAFAKLGGHTDEQEAAARRALALDPASAQAHRQMAYVLTGRGDPAGALEHMREAMRLAPGRGVMQLGLGFTLADDGRMEEAAAAMARAVELDPLVNFNRLSAAGVEVHRRRYAQATELLKRNVASDPQDLLSAGDLAKVYLTGFGDLAASRNVLDAASVTAAASGPLADAWFAQFLLQRDFPAAVHVIDQAPQNWFDNGRLPRGAYLGRAERAQSHAAQARAAFASARVELEGWLKSDPKDARLHARLALAMAGTGELDAALREASQAQLLNRMKRLDGEILVVLAQVQALAGRTDDAFMALEKLSKIPAGNAVSAALLRLDPDWDVLRKDARFETIVARFVEVEEAANPMNDLLQRLRERKLVQWALAYAAAAFALLQGLDIVAQQFAWPDGVRRGITIALLVGFFVTLVLAWYHGERGMQRVSGTELLILTLLLALGGGVLWRVAQGPRDGAAAERGATVAGSAPVAVDEKSIAVLPLANTGGDPANEYFSDGLSEELISVLAKIPDLKTIGRSSSFHFKNTSDDSRLIRNPQRRFADPDPFIATDPKFIPPWGESLVEFASFDWRHCVTVRAIPAIH